MSDGKSLALPHSGRSYGAQQRRSEARQYTPDRWREGSSILGTLGIANTGNREGNELVSVFARWVFEESAAEIYAEWARDDALGEWAEFLQEPDHAQAYLLGFQKVAPLSTDLSLRVQ